MSVTNNTSFGLEMQSRPRSEVGATVSHMLELVKLPEIGKRRADQLSDGQQQCIALARTLASQPKVLPFGESPPALNLKLRKEVQTELEHLRHKAGTTFTFITRGQGEALTMFDRIAMMSKGEMLQVNTPNDIYEVPLNQVVADFIDKINLFGDQTDTNGVRLVDSQQLTATALNNGAVTLTTRPERTELAADGQLEGVLKNVVCVDTNTTYHLNVVGQSGFRMRQQNHDGIHCLHSPGAEVRIRVLAVTIRVLAE